MDGSAKRFLSTALVVPALSLTMLHYSNSAAQADSVLGRIFAGNKTQPVIEAKSTAGVSDPRIDQLEQTVRELNGKVEELNFMILQMQSHIDAFEGHKQETVSEKSGPATPNAAATGTDNSNGKVDRLSNTGAITEPTTSTNSNKQPSDNNTAIGERSAQDLGSVHFDSDGNIIPSTNETANTTATVPVGGNTVVAVPDTKDSKELYQIGYQHVLAGDYRAAEAVFRAFQERFPKDPMISDATFWLGESLYGQGRYREAAQVYIDVQRNYKDTSRGPENLLKLGMSMAQLDETDVACKTLNEVPKRYKKAEPAIIKRVKDERSRLNCP